MGTLNIRLTEDEIQQLIRKYRVPEKEGLVNYADFADYIDSVFTEKANPTDVIGMARSTAVRLIQIIITVIHLGRNGGHGRCCR